MKLSTFIDKANLIHGGKYKYLDINKGYIEIECFIHGVFKQNIYKHLQGRGCQKCGKDRVVNIVNSTKILEKEFVNKLKNKFNDVIILNSEYIDYNTKINFKCINHGIFCKTPKNVLINGCNKCNKEYNIDVITSRKNTFLKKAKSIYGNINDYSEIDYINMHSHINIICNIHGLFSQTPSNHLKYGCYKCSKNNNLHKEIRYFNFKNKFLQLYKESNITLYDNVYINDKTKIKLHCDKHGLFESLPSNVLKGTCCKKCGIERIVKFNKENTVGWSYTNWENASIRSKYFDTFKVYILKFKKEGEVFYKIGKTFRKTKSRIREFTESNYEIEILSEFIFTSARECSEYEQKLKNNNKENSYKPNIYFKGYTECFIKLNE